MRASRFILLAVAFTAVSGFGTNAPDPMPRGTIPLSSLVRALTANPGVTDALLKDLDAGHRKSGPALLTPDLLDHLRTLIQNRDFSSLDRFPGWTMAEITPTVGAISHIAADKDSPQAQEALTQFLDVGIYPLFDTGLTALPVIDFRLPSPAAPFTTRGIVTDLGAGVTRGDGPGPLAPEHAESQRLADVLNRLAANSLDGVAPVSAIWDDRRTVSTPEELITAIMQTGNSVTVTDSRYFANFGHLHYNGPNGEQDVMMPFWVNSQIVIPGTSRPLLVPVSHAEYEWHVRGPLMNADVSFYFGVDGKAEFRTMDTLDQAWVMHRDAHTYRQSDVVEVTRLTGAMLRAYMRLHQAHPQVPFGGYYAFGVCQDVVAAIELKLNGQATLFPNTADDRFFAPAAIDPRDEEIAALIRRLPKDRSGKPPDTERIFRSLPVGSSDEELATIMIPGLGRDLTGVHDAWVAGTLKRTESIRIHRLKIAALAALALGGIAFALYRLWPRRRDPLAL